MLLFVEGSFEYGFAKGSTQAVSRVFFEAVSVGVHLAIKEKPDIRPYKIDIRQWLKDPNFYSLISGKYKTHTPDKIRQRIDYVKNNILHQFSSKPSPRIKLANSF